MGLTNAYCHVYAITVSNTIVPSIAQKTPCALPVQLSFPPEPLAITDFFPLFFLPPVFLPFPEYHKNGITQYVAFQAASLHFARCSLCGLVIHSRFATE